MKATACIMAALLAVSTWCVGEELTAQQILEKAMGAHRALNSWVSEGTVVCDMETGAGKMSTTTKFSLVLGKPNRYKITWKQEAGEQAPLQSGAAWSAGEHPSLYMSTAAGWCPMDNDEMAIGAATGVSGGAAFTVPSLFFEKFMACQVTFERMTHPVVTGSEKIFGEVCYIVSSPTTISREETFWLSRDTFLVRQYRRSLEAPESGRDMPEMTDEQIEEGLRAVGQEINETNKNQYRCMMQAMKSMSMKGTISETHEKVSFPELDQKDFMYTPPEGTTRQDTFGNLISAAMKTAPAAGAVAGSGAGVEGATHSPKPGDAPGMPAGPATDAAMLASCQNNLKQCGLIFKMFCNESSGQIAPALSSVPGRLLWEQKEVYPEYIADPAILVCPGEKEKSLRLGEMKDFDSKAAVGFQESSYWYLGYALPDDETALAFAAAYKKRAAVGGGFGDDLKADSGKPILRLREGIGRLLIKDINDPGACARLEASLPLIIEKPGHHPGKINMLFMDGHVESRVYPGDYPASQAFIEALQGLEALTK